MFLCTSSLGGMWVPQWRDGCRKQAWHGTAPFPTACHGIWNGTARVAKARPTLHGHGTAQHDPVHHDTPAHGTARYINLWRCTFASGSAWKAYKLTEASEAFTQLSSTSRIFPEYARQVQGHRSDLIVPCATTLMMPSLLQMMAILRFIPKWPPGSYYKYS